MGIEFLSKWSKFKLTKSQNIGNGKMTMTSSSRSRLDLDRVDLGLKIGISQTSRSSAGLNFNVIGKSVVKYWASEPIYDLQI